MSYGVGEYTYELIDNWAKLPQGWSFRDIGGIAIDREDNVYVLNRSEYPLMVFDREGNLLRYWGKGLFSRAHGNCISPDGFIYCTDDGNHTVFKFTLCGELVQTIGGKPSNTGYVPSINLWQSLSTIKRADKPFNRPTGVAVASSGEIYVSDGYGNARIHKFTSDGNLLLSWGEPGGEAGQFRVPHNIWVDRRGRVWVADRENHRIQIFDSSGRFISQWTYFIRPTAVIVDVKGIVYTSEFCLRVSIFTNEGKLLASWGNEQKNNEPALFHAPHALTVDSRGDLYVGEVSMTVAGIDKGPNTIHKFKRRG